jgi:hypothetical protein
MTLRIVRDRMRDAMAQHRLAHALERALGGEFGTVHADDDELPRERVLEPAQRLERLQAAHGGISPEVENDEPAAQLGERQWAIDVQPCDAGQVEVRRADRRGAAHGVCRCLFTPRASRALYPGARFQSAAA